MFEPETQTQSGINDQGKELPDPADAWKERHEDEDELLQHKKEEQRIPAGVGT